MYDKDQELLEKFICDENLKKLEKTFGQFNIFDCLKLTRAEIRHSNFLAWLLNPNENHGFNDLFLKKFLIKVLNKTDIRTEFYLIQEIKQLDLQNVEIVRERENIDLLIIDEKNKFVVVIENKIDTFQHDNQLIRYKNYVECQDSMKDFKKIYLYLSRQKEKIEEPYKFIDYNLINECLKEILEETVLSLGVKLAIENYIEIIERDIMDKDGIRKICRMIYKEHSKAIDTLCKYKDLRDYMSALLQEIITEDSNLMLLDSSKYWIRFIPKKSDYESLHFAQKDWVNSNKVLIFEINNELNHINIDIVVRLTNQEETIEKRKCLMNVIKSFKEFENYQEVNKKDCYDHIISKNLFKNNDNDDYNDLVTKTREEIKQALKRKIEETKTIDLFDKIAKTFNNSNN